MVLSDSVEYASQLARVGHRVAVVASPAHVAVASAHLRALGAVVREEGVAEFEAGGRVRLVSNVLQLRGMVVDEVFVPADTLPAAFADIVPALAPGGDTITYELERAGV